MSDKLNVHYLLMAGGSGKRLWPSSRLLYPKPLFRPEGKDSLIGSILKMIVPWSPASEVTILLGSAHEKVFRSHIGGIDTGSLRIDSAAEPVSRNTAPAITLGVMRIMREMDEGEDAIFVVLPSDQVVSEKPEFQKAVDTAVSAAAEGYIVTIGVEPDRPETSYGYIERGKKIVCRGTGEKIFRIKRFVEKPDIETAKEYLSRSFLWNCGIFVFRGRVMIEELRKYSPDVFSAVRKSFSKESFSGVDAKSYAKSPDISIDYAVMEKTGLGAVVPASFGWSDVGSWEAVYKLLTDGKRGNCSTGDVVLEDSENCFVQSKGGRLIVGKGLKDLLIVDEDDALLVADMEHSAEIKPVVDRLIKDKRPEPIYPPQTEHPWGVEKRLEKGSDSEGGGEFSVSSITVNPGMEFAPRASAAVRMVVLRGKALAVFGADSANLDAGDVIEVPDDVPVYLKNTGKSVLNLLNISFDSAESSD